MKISKKSEYGLRALINLGIAHALGHTRVTGSDLAAADNLPLKFLEQIFNKLKSAGYIDTQRGKMGGYFLAKNPDEIKIGDLVRLLDGPLAPIACASPTAYEPCSCTDETHCGLRMIMIDVRNAIAGILDKYTLGDLVNVTLRKIRRTGSEHYFQQGKLQTKTLTETGNSDPANPADGFLNELLEAKS